MHGRQKGGVSTNPGTPLVPVGDAAGFALGFAWLGGGVRPDRNSAGGRPRSGYRPEAGHFITL